MDEHDSPSLAAEIALSLGGVLAAVWGFVTRQVWINTSRLSAIEQAQEDLKGTINRMHGENLDAHRDIAHRVEELERRQVLRQTHDYGKGSE